MEENFLQIVNQIKNLTKDQFEALFQISKTLNNAIYAESLIEQALDWVINIINAERGLFVRYKESENEFSIIAARHINKESIKNIKEFSSGILLEVIKRKSSLLYHDAQSDPRISQYESITIKGIKSVIGVPVFRDEKVWGVILADSQMDRREFTEENLIFLNFFSNLFSLALDKVINIEKLQYENIILQNKLESTHQIPEMIGKSKAMTVLSDLIFKVAKTNTTVLILGESGTGKDLVANAIHKLSERKNYPYLAQFCGSIPDSLLESELFGYKKGAFTGANSDKKGLLEVADKGTFFLDEIADISTALQAKLLRVLENKEIIRLGDTQTKKIDVRILAATNKDLMQLVKEGKFREDLFYRLNIFPIQLPTLRERKEDIPQLVRHFIDSHSKENLVIERNALLKLEKYYWPGNVRQLLNVIQRAIILCDEKKIEEKHIIIENQNDEDNFNGTLEDYQILILKKRLKEYNGNRTQTAESLGVSVRWIQLKLKELGIS